MRFDGGPDSAIYKAVLNDVSNHNYVFLRWFFDGVLSSGNRRQAPV